MGDNIITSLHKKISGLTEISGDNLEKLFSSAVKSDIPKGKKILRQGQVCNSIFFIEKGFLRMFIKKDNKEINVGFAFEDEFATSLKSLRLSTPSDISLEAAENSTLYEFSKAGLLALYRSSPEIESFGRTLVEHLLIAQEDHANLFKLFSPKERYDHLMASNPQVIQRVSLSHIASYLGVARETLSRVRKIK